MSFTPEQEAKILTLIEHPNITALVDVLDDLTPDAVDRLILAINDAAALHPVAEQQMLIQEQAPLIEALTEAEQALADYEIQCEQARQEAIATLNASFSEQYIALMVAVNNAKQALGG